MREQVECTLGKPGTAEMAFPIAAVSNQILRCRYFSRLPYPAYSRAMRERNIYCCHYEHKLNGNDSVPCGSTAVRYAPATFAGVGPKRPIETNSALAVQRLDLDNPNDVLAFLESAANAN